MDIVDRIFGWLLVVASLPHSMGSIGAYRNTPVTLEWALSGTLAGLLVAGLNLLRVGRQNDRPLAWLSFSGCLGWVAVALAFGKAMGTILDYHVLVHVTITIVLAAICLYILLRSSA